MTRFYPITLSKSCLLTRIWLLTTLCFLTIPLIGQEVNGIYARLDQETKTLDIDNFDAQLVIAYPGLTRQEVFPGAISSDL